MSDTGQRPSQASRPLRAGRRTAARRAASGLLAALAVVLSTMHAAASTAPLYLVDTPFDTPQNSRIYLVDPATGEMTLRADLGTAWSPVLGLAAASESVLYATGSDPGGMQCTDDGCLLLRIELDPLSPTPLAVTVIGPILAGGQEPGKIVGLNFRQDSMLYGLGQDTDSLYIVDPATAQATLVGVVDLDVYGGDLTFSTGDQLLMWTNTAGGQGLYDLDPQTAQASAFELHPGLGLAGLAALGHEDLIYGSSPGTDLLYEIDAVSGFTGTDVPLSLDAQPFDHKRGDLDSPFCATDASCDDTNTCTADTCSPGGCAYENLDLGQTSCGVGECSRTVDVCEEGMPQTCVPGAPATEVCDGLDNDCDGVADNNIPPAGPPPHLDLETAGPSQMLAWDPVNAETGFNIVRGNAAVLHQTGGDFSQSVNACLASGLPSTSIEVAAVPPPDTIYFYLVEPTSCSGGPGYDAGGPGQSGSRNASIAGSPAACP